jgi:FkbM family methyltransferase
MKEHRGIWLPDDDDHFAEHLDKGPLFDEAGTYQFAKIMQAMGTVGATMERPLGLALDIGGHVGLWSRVLCAYFSRVIAFEPVDQLADCFARNAPDAELHRVALGNHDCPAHMTMTEGNSGNAHVATGGNSPVSCLVRMRKLDSFDLPRVDFIKMDVEGFEAYVIDGADYIIRRDRPVIVVECKPGNAERYGLQQQEALYKLTRDFGMKVVWSKSGDHCLRF